MVRLFLGNRAGVLMLLPLVIAGYVAIDMFTGYYKLGSSANLGLWGESVNLYPLLSRLSAAVLILLNALAINLIYNTNEFLERNSYMSSLLYVVLMSFYHSFYSLDGLLIAHSFIIAMIYQMFRLRQNEDSRRYAFNAAFFAGIASTFHPPMAVMVPVVLFMVWTIRPFIFRETLLVLIGFSIPLLYAGVFLWLSGHRIELRILEQSTDYVSKRTDFLVTAVLFTLLFLLSLVSIRGRMQKSSIRLKKLVNILWWLVLVGIAFGIVDFVFFGQIERFSFLMLPLSFFLTFSFSNQTYGAVATGLFYLTLAYSCLKFFL